MGGEGVEEFTTEITESTEGEDGVLWRRFEGEPPFLSPSPGGGRIEDLGEGAGHGA